jgi:hypothetical protein
VSKVYIHTVKHKISINNRPDHVLYWLMYHSQHLCLFWHMEQKLKNVQDFRFECQHYCFLGCGTI